MHSHQNITACLFDMDGTLIDSEPVWIEAIHHALVERGVSITLEEVREMEYGRAWQDIFADIKRQWPDVFDTRHDMELVTGAYYEKVTGERDISIASSVELLRRLALDGHVIAIVSGSTRTRIAQVIHSLGMDGLVSTFIGCGDYEKGKPAPDCYLKAAQVLGVKPQECIAFEDSNAGVLSAKNAGMTCIALQREKAALQDFSAADLVLHELNDFTFSMLTSRQLQ